MEMFLKKDSKNKIMAKYSIHIKKSHKGLFTKKAKAAGMSVQAFAKHVKAHPENYSGSTRKQANFARVAKTKFHHQAGGTPYINPDDPNYLQQQEKQRQLAMENLTPGPMYSQQKGIKNDFNPFFKNTNTLLQTGTFIADTINNIKNRQDEYKKYEKSIQPHAFSNPDQQGLNNVPVYTEYGGGMDLPQLGLIYLKKLMAAQWGGAPINRADVPKNVWAVPGGWSKYRFGDDYVTQNGGGGRGIWRPKPGVTMPAMAVGGVSPEKAREILRDGTAQGHKLTAKQKRYFGWIAGGGKAQTGAAVAPQTAQTSASNQNLDPDAYYGQNAILSYYKNQLNDKLKAKNPKAFEEYFKGLQEARKSTKPEDVDKYIKESKYNDYLTPDEVKSTLGQGYNRYLNSLHKVNTYNVNQGKRPLYGDIEGENDINKLNFGRRFASLQVTPHYGLHENSPAGGKDYSREYVYDPEQNAVRIQETGDLTLRPKNFANSPTVPEKDIAGTYQAGGYAEGDELDLTPEEIDELIKQGYEFEAMTGGQFTILNYD